LYVVITHNLQGSYHMIMIGDIPSLVVITHNLQGSYHLAILV
jgi:hypothetical protein